MVPQPLRAHHAPVDVRPGRGHVPLPEDRPRQGIPALPGRGGLPRLLTPIRARGRQERIR